LTEGTEEEEEEEEDDGEGDKDNEADEEEADEEEDDDGEHDQEPASCIGHFDRLDVEHAPKPTKQARVYVFYDENPVASWSGTPLLQQNKASQRWDSVVADRKRARELGLLEDSSETEGRRTPPLPPPTSGPSIVLSAPSDEEEEDDDEQSDGLPPSRTLETKVEEPRRSPRHSHPPTTSSQHSPMQMLKRLRVSRNAVRRPEYEDPFIACRLAATSVLMVHDGLLAEAERLGRWSVDLVGKRAWDKNVEVYISAPRLETDDGDWMSSMLDDVHTSLRSIDEERAAELRGMISRWQEMDILPGIIAGGQ
jgi:hypothetical protein